MDEDPIRRLHAAVSEVADRREARASWVRAVAVRVRAAQREMDDRLEEAVDRVGEEEFDRLVDEEQARVDAIHDQLKDAAERDLWPRDLYWGGI